MRVCFVAVRVAGADNGRASGFPFNFNNKKTIATKNEQ